MKDIILTGIQGSGKGTQSALLLREFGTRIRYFEAGGILRALQSKPNAIGDYTKEIVNSGKLLPDQFMVKVFDLFLFTLQGGEGSLLVDGFPRQIAQMHGFLEKMEDYKRDFLVVALDIPKEEAIKRLTSRRMCKHCGAILNIHLHDCSCCPICSSTDIYQRNDDADRDAIITRINLFEQQTRPVIAHLDSMGLVRHINGMQTTDSIFKEISPLIS